MFNVYVSISSLNLNMDIPKIFIGNSFYVNLCCFIWPNQPYIRLFLENGESEVRQMLRLKGYQIEKYFIKKVGLE